MEDGSSVDDGSSMDNWVSHDWVSHNRVDWGWLVSWSRVGNTLVLDIGNVAAIAGGIGVVVHNLDAAVGKGHPVVSSHSSTIRSLVLAKVGTRVLILNTILKSIRLGWLSVAMDRSWLVNNRQGVNRSWWWCIRSRMHW